MSRLIDVTDKVWLRSYRRAELCDRDGRLHSGRRTGIDSRAIDSAPLVGRR